MRLLQVDRNESRPLILVDSSFVGTSCAGSKLFRVLCIERADRKRSSLQFGATRRQEHHTERVSTYTETILGGHAEISAKQTSSQGCSGERDETFSSFPTYTLLRI
jgi:hypothetical protein